MSLKGIPIAMLIKIAFGTFTMKELVLLPKFLPVKLKKSQQHLTNALHTSASLSIFKIEQLNSKIQLATRFYFAKTFFQKVQVQFIFKVIVKITLLLINSVHLKVKLLQMANLLISKVKSTVQFSRDQFVMEEVVQ